MEGDVGFCSVGEEGLVVVAVAVGSVLTGGAAEPAAGAGVSGSALH